MRMRNNQRFFAFVPLLLLLTMSLGGCVDLSAVRKLAAISSQSVSYTELVRDYVEQPNRLKMYQPEDRHEALTKEATDRQRQAVALRAVQDVLSGYLDALGELAADDLSDYSKELDSLAAQIKGAGNWFAGSDVDTVSKAAKGIAKALTDYYRQKKLKEIIISTDPAIRELTDDLIMIFGTLFEASLDNELGNLARFEKSILLTPGVDAGVKQLAKLELARDRLAIAQKKAALVAYVKVLRGVRDGHHRLFESAGNLANKKALEAIYKRANQLVKDLKAVYELR